MIGNLKARFGLVLSLLLGMGASGGALAVCDVTVNSIMGQTVVLQANCSGGGAAPVPVTGITWRRDGNSLNGATDIVVPSTTAPIHYTTPLLSGPHSYTATANAGAIAAGTAGTVTGAQWLLTVAPTAGGTVSSTPGGIDTCSSNSPGGACSNGYDNGTAVVLTAAQDNTHTFSGWAGDCTGTGACVLAMTAPRTVVATFGSPPINGACDPATSNSTPVSSAPSANLCTTGTPTAVADPGTASAGSFTWGCNGINAGSTSTAANACSAPKSVLGVCGTVNGLGPVASAPTGTAACNPGTITNMTPGASQYTWTCTGFNNGGNSQQCAVNITPTPGVCGTAGPINGVNQNVATQPTGTAACSSGNLQGQANVNNTFSWTCAGLAGGGSAQCTANQTINAACGADNGQALTSTPTNLCAAGNNASAVTGSGPWTWSCSGINPTSGPVQCSATLSTVANCPTPAPNTRVFGKDENDNYTAISFDWVFNHLGLTLDSKVDVNSTKAHMFINAFPSTSKTGGKIDMAQGNRGTNNKDIAISTCPGQFDNLPAGCARLGYLTSAIYWTYNGAKYAGVVTACKIEPGVTYYLNIRPAVAGQEAGYAINSQ